MAVRVNADAYFSIGAAHVTSGVACQDYAMAGEDYGIVCDGCSSGGRTDIGARMLALELDHLLSQHTTTEPLGESHWTMLAALAKQGSRLNADDLLATMLYVRARDGTAWAQVMGDGVVAIKYANGRIEMERFMWNEGAPMYPAYLVGQLYEFYAFHDTERPFQRESWECSSDGTYQEGSVLNYPATSATAFGINGASVPFDKSVAVVAVFSDGIGEVEGVDWKDAVVEAMAFKTFSGAFVRRRMIRAVKTWEKEGHHPKDDISMAALSFGNCSQSPEGGVGFNHGEV
ncbi:MAG: protein phosphatase 2C domain-containing protein [Gammaproteobacteria bacterium]